MSAGPSLRRFLARTALPIAAGAAAAIGLFAGVLFWSSGEADRIAVERQEKLADLVISQLREGIAHDQESATVWDDAVVNARRLDADWLDNNLGAWMHSYFGHDGAFVLDARDRPVFASLDGRRAEPSAYGRVAAQAAPLVAGLRDRLRRSDANGTSDHVLTPGAADLAVVDGHPAVISIKPIVSDTGAIAQVPGEEYLHVSLRRLDGGFLSDLERDYLFEGLRFGWTQAPRAGETSMALRAGSGSPIGFLMWRPFRPGASVMGFVAPALLALAVLTAAGLAALTAHLRRRSLKLAASEAEVHHLALHDPLTGLANRTTFNRRLDGMLAAGGGAAVLFLDLDRFKQVNDTLGHATGDELIRGFAGRLRALLRPADVVARVGGDEFTVALAEPGGPEAIEAVCRRIAEAVGEPFDIDGNHIAIGVSIGVALAPRDGRSRAELTRKADIALYHAKSCGRGRHAFFGKDMDALLQERRDIEHDLRAALEREDGIEVFFQPLYAAGSGQVTGVEALSRWRHPERGWIAPDRFIPVAEECGLIGRLGETVLRKACRAAVGWPVERVAVNVSAVELRDPAYALRVANILLSAGMSPGRLELEVTESALADDRGACDSNVAALREFGVRIALDDFGTGFSSLSRLKRLAVDSIKIDRSFVQGVGRSPSDEAIVQAIVSLAKATGLRITAEGVETEEQSRFLALIGCDELQGFLLSRPVPEAEAQGLLGVAAAQRLG